MATMKQQHAQAHKDYLKLKSLYGDVYDFCGGWCNNDVMDDLLEDPSPKNALKHLKTLIRNYFENNFESKGDIDTKHPDVYDIGKRYGFL
ncbi:MAG: hypothetical protein HAW67_03530 [Endozoicomonadaceae bacterium]|nr:hypothetical protein [Endozoicomonadaceae bacterium]